MLADEVSFSHRGERHFSAAAGLAGGGEGARARSTIRRADGRLEEIPSKIVTTLRKGDRVVVETAGGGGYGESRERPAARVEADVRDGKVSPEMAKHLYYSGAASD
jgi:N-methylhydantoinase B/oxoprolinase/acetone carboxylase alpha subunit